MDYYTEFELDIYSGTTDFDELLIAVNKLSDIRFNHYGQAEGEWCSYYEDMLIISKEFPDCILLLHGQEVDANDIWRVYFKNGVSQVCRAKITFDPCTL